MQYLKKHLHHTSKTDEKFTLQHTWCNTQTKHMKHTSKHMKPHAKRCHGVCRPVLLLLLLLLLGPSLSGHSTCTGSHTPHAPHAEQGHMGSHVLPRAPRRTSGRTSFHALPPEWVVARAPICCPTLHTPHTERVAATLPCVALHKGPVRAPPYCNCVHHFFLDRHVLAAGGGGLWKLRATLRT
jgi:hypothetical protein